jgi:hypothetical protein
VCLCVLRPSDVLGKMDQVVETTVKKVQKTHHELKGDQELMVENGTPKTRDLVSGLSLSLTPLVCLRTCAAVTCEQYIEKFEWNTAAFPKIASLQQISNQIHAEVVKYDEDVRKKTAELMDVQQSLGAIERKET